MSFLIFLAALLFQLGLYAIWRSISRAYDRNAPVYRFRSRLSDGGRFNGIR